MFDHAVTIQRLLDNQRRASIEMLLRACVKGGYLVEAAVTQRITFTTGPDGSTESAPVYEATLTYPVPHCVGEGSPRHGIYSGEGASYREAVLKATEEILTAVQANRREKGLSDHQRSLYRELYAMLNDVAGRLRIAPDGPETGR